MAKIAIAVMEATTEIFDNPRSNLACDVSDARR